MAGFFLSRWTSWLIRSNVVSHHVHIAVGCCQPAARRMFSASVSAVSVQGCRHSGHCCYTCSTGRDGLARYSEYYVELCHTAGILLLLIIESLSCFVNQLSTEEASALLSAGSEDPLSAEMWLVNDRVLTEMRQLSCSIPLCMLMVGIGFSFTDQWVLPKTNQWLAYNTLDHQQRVFNSVSRIPSSHWLTL